MIIYNINQSTEEWQALRIGKFTASNFHIFLGNSQTRTNEIYKKAAERLTGKKCDQDNFRNGHTERGHELEDLAREAYTFETGNEVEQVGFVELDDFVGCSPDGLINSKGLIEIKCLDNHGFIKAKNKDYIAPIHKTQIQFCLMVTNREYLDYVIFNPNFGDKGLIIRTVERDEEYIDKIKDALEKAKNEVIKEIELFSKN